MADAATERVETVTITLDGKEVTAQPGELIIAAAERAGVYIPRFCYHPRMRPVGMCRMCLVEVVGPRGPMLQPACFVPVADGQEVVTASTTVKSAQDAVLEFLLINHPLDCPVCDKGGECPLQDQTLAYGPGESRFAEEKRHWEKPIPLSDLVLIDRERCIQCDRCTRFATDIAGDPLINFVGRGNHVEVNTFPDHPFASYFSGNTVQICPVGALLANPYRFRARPWDLEQVESTCTTCAVGCRITVQSSQDRLVRYLGIDSDPVNQGWLCDRGRFNFEAVGHDERLSRPLIRTTDEHLDATWFDALERAADGLRDVKTGYGPGAIGVLGGARLANEDAYAWAKLAKSVLGTDSVDAQLDDGLPAEMVLGLPRATIDDACAASTVLLLGPDLKEDLPVLYLRLRAAAVDGQTSLVELAPRSTGLSRYAAATAQYRPGEVADLVDALVGAGEPVDSGGVAAATIAAAREAIGAGEDLVVVLGRPSLAEPAASVSAAVAKLREAYPEARFLSALRRGNVHGALDMGLAPGMLPGRVTLDDGRDWYRAAWGSVPDGRGLSAAEILRAAADGQIHGLVLLGADPLSDFPDNDLARQALTRAGFVVAVDAFLTASARHAHVVLPAAVFGERGGTTTNIEGRITRLAPKITAPGVAWPDWVIASELAARLDADLGFSSIDDVWAEICQLAPSHAGITGAVLGARPNRDGVVAPLGTVPAARAFAVAAAGPTGGVAADSAAGLVDTNTPGPDTERAAEESIEPSTEPAAPAAAAQGTSDVTATAGSGPEAAVGDHPVPDVPKPTLVKWQGNGEFETPRADGYALRLVATRNLYDRAVFTSRSPSLAGLARTQHAALNPHELDRLGIGDGDRLRVSTPRAETVVAVVADAGVPRGCIAMPFNVAPDGPGDMIDSSQRVVDVKVETV